ncbi:MAG TPA: choice-of-anchor tandem repeat GloVer-containing protein, partial [Candidatus Binatia bacterium]|nr:choice-of-anchor tandem repeat GloVer-containing protein [Candidatus Binatia bacterium]
GVPEGGLIFATSGSLYGTTEAGGAGNGTVFELRPSQDSWTLNTIYTFPGPGVPGPAASLALDGAGNIYGTTLSGPPQYPPCEGSVFELSRLNGAWNYMLLHCFTGGSDGGQPYSPVTMDRYGNLYGTAFEGGANGDGVVWEISR